MFGDCREPTTYNYQTYSVKIENSVHINTAEIDDALTKPWIHCLVS